MTKTGKKLLNFIMGLIAVLISLAIGGAFVSGLFTSVVILKYLPLIIHQIVGWIIIVLTLISTIWKIAA